MTPELIVAIIALLGATTTFLKTITDNVRIKNDRALTKTERDADSTVLHDQCRENAWEIKRLKEERAVIQTHLDDHQLQLSVLNTELAKLSTKMDSILEAVKELKADRE